MEVNLFRNARDSQTLASGEVLFREGDHGDTTFVDQKHFTYLVHEHPTFALQVMTIMAERLRRTNG
jgi:hypothetical protein